MLRIQANHSRHGILATYNLHYALGALDTVQFYLVKVRILEVLQIVGARQYGEHQEDSIVTYVYTILENISGEKAQQCFWDFSQWADLWRIWRPVKDDRFPAEIVDIQVRCCLCTFGHGTQLLENICPSCTEHKVMMRLTMPILQHFCTSKLPKYLRIIPHSFRSRSDIRSLWMTSEIWTAVFITAWFLFRTSCEDNALLWATQILTE